MKIKIKRQDLLYSFFILAAAAFFLSLSMYRVYQKQMEYKVGRDIGKEIRSYHLLFDENLSMKSTLAEKRDLFKIKLRASELLKMRQIEKGDLIFIRREKE